MRATFYKFGAQLYVFCQKNHLQVKFVNFTPRLGASLGRERPRLGFFWAAQTPGLGFLWAELRFTSWGSDVFNSMRATFYKFGAQLYVFCQKNHLQVKFVNFTPRLGASLGRENPSLGHSLGRETQDLGFLWAETPKPWFFSVNRNLRDRLWSVLLAALYLTWSDSESGLGPCLIFFWIRPDGLWGLSTGAILAKISELFQCNKE